ncbi:MAG TPA: ATP-binding protein [Tepidisphaeraceae bacterium]|jgi:signal transduction histidine kinase|nr:ATP-binding protein [Tepidisphaeraceae bacterium]
MFKRLRRLQISLAAKCQLLFGAAVILIIAAALFFPFRRMEQLMEQLNSTAASTLADAALRDHLIHPRATTRPTTSPVLLDGRPYTPPRLISASDDKDQSNTLTRFERRAFKEFTDHPETPFYARNYEYNSIEGYRYARPLYNSASCLPCHSPSEAPRHNEAAASSPLSSILHPLSSPSSPVPTTEPTTQSTLPTPQFLGLISIDIDSQIDPNQLLLNRLLLFTAGLLAGTLATVVFYLITTRLILQPVRVLQKTAERVAEGNLNIRSDISTGDEFQQLSETFNTMLANLQLSGEQLRSINQNLDLKLNEMAESNLALYESNRLKNEFLANVSHELRTPLNSILGFAELLRDTPAAGTDPKSIRYVQNILTSGKNLLELINDLLDLAKIEAGKMEVRSEPLTLPDLFEGLSSILKPLTEQKKLTLDPDVATDVPILHTDPAKLQQVLYNFLSNAIKFSPEGGRITLIATRESESTVRISVSDQGPGIPPEKQSLIFEKFRQLDASVTRQHSGTGLGLSISKELTTLLGGTIAVSSPPNQGATFSIILPIKIQPSSQDLRQSLSLT